MTGIETTLKGGQEMRRVLRLTSLSGLPSIYLTEPIELHKLQSNQLKSSRRPESPRKRRFLLFSQQPIGKMSAAIIVGYTLADVPVTPEIALELHL